MLRVWILAVSGVIFTVGFVGIGLYYVPDGERLRPAHEAQWRGLDLPPPYMDYICGSEINPEMRHECEISVRNNAPGDRFDLVFPQDIPTEDCALMARVLRDDAKVEVDGSIYLNINGRSNCNFAAHGLEHYIEHEPDGGYALAQPFAYSKRIVSPATYAFAYRYIYVSRPQYSLFRTRAVIAVGRDGEGSSGYICVYNRFSGQWQREDECTLSWMS